MSGNISSGQGAESGRIERVLAGYIAGTTGRSLPAEVEGRVRLHLLDTLAAIVSGRKLRPGAQAYAFAESLGGQPESTLIGSDVRVGAAHAALANGMAAHADETDDSHTGGRFHPGCGIVPAALAIAERRQSSSADLLKAVALGYDIGARATMALGYASPKTATFSTHTLGSQFGAAAAASALLELNPAQTEAMLSFTVQQASGLPYWNRDPDHIEKAFDFGGKGSRDGIYAALMAEAGFTAPDAPLTGERGFLSAFAHDADPEALIDGLGVRFEILQASLKKWCVGSPIQSVLDGIQFLQSEHDLEPDDIEQVVITLPSDRFHIIDNREIPTICVQHLAALLLHNRSVGFHDAHDESLMAKPEIRSLRARIRAVPDDDLAEARPARQSIVTIDLRNGRQLYRHTRAVHGTPERPMSPSDLAVKVQDILGDLIPGRVDRLIDVCVEDAMFDITDLIGLCKLD